MRHELCSVYLPPARTAPMVWRRWEIRIRRDGNNVEWSGSQFFSCAKGEGKTRRVKGGRGVFWTRDVEAQVMRSARVSGQFCEVDYMRTCRKGIEKHTHLYWVFIMGVICMHLNVGGGWTLLCCVCMHTYENDRLRHTSIGPGVDHDRDQQHAS